MSLSLIADIEDLSMKEFRALSGEIQLALTLKFPQHWVPIDFWHEQVPVTSPNKLTGDVKVLVQFAEAMNSGEALVWYSIVTERFVFIRDHTSADAAEQRIFTVDWSAVNLSGQVPAKLLDQLPRLTELNMKENELTFWENDALGLQRLGLHNVGLGITEEINTLIECAKSLGRDANLVMER